MSELVGYIFKSLSANDTATRNLTRVVNNHNKALRWSSICICVLGTHMMVKTLEDATRDKKIAELKKEIEELKQKGE